MGLETFTGIWSFNTSWPDGATDTKGQGDNHIRGIKSALRTTWPNVLGVVSASESELNFCVGVTSAIQAQLNAKAPLNNPSFGGTATFNAITVSGAANFSTSPTAPTATAGDSSTKGATTACVAAAAFAAVLPAQDVSKAGYVLVTDGTSADWEPHTAQNLYFADNFV